MIENYAEDRMRWYLISEEELEKIKNEVAGKPGLYEFAADFIQKERAEAQNKNVTDFIKAGMV